MSTPITRTQREAKAAVPNFANVLHDMPKNRGQRGLQEVARECARQVHYGERFKLKRVVGPYIAHPEWVATRMHTEEEVLTALLHDVIEKMLKEQRKWMDKHPAAPKIFADEEQGIAQLKGDVNLFFRRRGYELAAIMPQLLDDLDVLTKRDIEKKNYRGYTDRIVAYARRTKRTVPVKVKKADLEHNSAEDRNLPESLLSPADVVRLAEYAAAKKRYDTEFRDVVLKARPLTRPERVARDEGHNGHARQHRKRIDRHLKRSYE